VVLTEDATQIAIGEEYRARAANADQRLLLAEVRPVAGNYGLAAGAAEAGLTL
jgi:hypothetical protein